jgi:hypothetical protein
VETRECKAQTTGSWSAERTTLFDRGSLDCGGVSSKMVAELGSGIAPRAYLQECGSSKRNRAAAKFFSSHCSERLHRQHTFRTRRPP